MHEWRTILADANTGDEEIEIWQADSREVTIPLQGNKGAGAVGFTIDLDNPAAEMITGTDWDGTALHGTDRLDKLLKVYRDGERMFVGDLISAEEQGDGGPGAEKLAVAALGPIHTRTLQRYLGKGAGGYRNGTALAQKDLGLIIENTLDALNTEAAPWTDTGIRKGTRAASSNGYVGPLYFKSAAELWVELAEQLGGPDLTLEPTEPTADVIGGQAALQIARLDLPAAQGIYKPNAAFEYGSGRRNVASYRRPIDATGQANIAYHLAPGYPDSVEAGITPIVVGLNLWPALLRWRETVVQTDLAVTQLRQILVNETVRVRGVPRETITFAPMPDAEPSWGDYKVGDLVPARAVAGGKIRFNAIARIYGVKFTISALGTEQVELTLVNEAAQVSAT